MASVYDPAVSAEGESKYPPQDTGEFCQECDAIRHFKVESSWDHYFDGCVTISTRTVASTRHSKHVVPGPTAAEPAPIADPLATRPVNGPCRMITGHRTAAHQCPVSDRHVTQNLILVSSVRRLPQEERLSGRVRQSVQVGRRGFEEP